MAQGRVIVFLIAALLAACSQPGASPAATQRLPAKPNPLSVTIKPDSGRAVKALIPVKGGSVSAAAADGSTFDLRVPDGALLSEQVVTLTPAESVDGLPFSGGMLASVDLSPAGLRLLKAATLTIKPARVATRGAIVFAYARDGKELHQYPFDEAAGAVRIDIYHFSGDGVADGTPAEASDENSKYPPSSGEMQAQASWAAAAAACRARQCDPNTDPTFRAAVEQAISAWFDGSVGPGLQAAETDDGQLGAALADWIEWELGAGKAGVMEKFSKQDAQARASAIKGLQNALEQASKRCAQNYEVGEIQNIFLWGAIAIKLGFESESGLDATSVNDRVRKCATFELLFDSTMVESTVGGPITARRSATVPLEPDVPLIGWTGQGELKGELSWPPLPHCTVNINPRSATLTVPLASMGLNLGTKETAIVVVVEPDTPTADITVSCPPAPTVRGGTDSWLPEWRVFHFSEQDEVTRLGYVIRDWDDTSAPPPTWATKTYQRSSGRITENTTLTLIHTPRT